MTHIAEGESGNMYAAKHSLTNRTVSTTVNMSLTFWKEPRKLISCIGGGQNYSTNSRSENEQNSKRINDHENEQTSQRSRVYHQLSYRNRVMGRHGVYGCFTGGYNFH